MLGAADISTPFVQGGPSRERPEALLMRPPRDPLSIAAGIFPHELFEVMSSIYGLADAPAQFNKTVRDKFRKLGGVSVLPLQKKGF